MRVVWKFVLRPGDILRKQDMIRPHVVLVGIDPQTGHPAVWIEHLTEQPPRVLYTRQDVEIVLVGTGHHVPEGWHHVGSTLDGEFVWHAYANITRARSEP